MIYTDLYNEVLIKPCQEGADSLKIVSGYATSAMVSDHLSDLYEKELNAHISLLVGMCPSDGLSLSNHNGFQSIVNSQVNDFKNRFSCSYIYKAPPIHGKLYIWYKDRQLYKAFIGSANYTQNAFYHQRELLAEIHDKNIFDYVQLIEKDSIFCYLPEAETLITIHNDANYYRRHIHEDRQANAADTGTAIEHIIVPLYSRKTGEVQNHAGLNWGHRDNYKREPNQAYIQLPPSVYKSDFFPPAPQCFNVVTDDNKSFLCRRAEKSKEGQTIHTPQNNSFLGEYFRNRLELANGAFVTRQDLKRYGREDVEFYKIGDEYYMDFSPPVI
jgi:hypothetical protein